MYIKEIRDSFESFLQREKTDQLAIIFSSYLFIFLISVGTNYWAGLGLLCTLAFVIVVVALRSQIFTSKFWGITTLLLGLKIVESWNGIGNHEYVVVYISLALTMTYSQRIEKRNNFIMAQTKYMFSLIMVIAGMQKLTTPEYMDGSTLEHMFLTGDFAPIIFNQDFMFADKIAMNKAAQLNFGNTFSEFGTMRFEWTSPFFHSISRPLAWLIVFSEITLGILAFSFANKVRFQFLTLAFVILTFAITQEGGFLSLLLVLTWVHLAKTPGKIHFSFFAWFLLNITFLITKISHP